jgi:hypothetical protein
MTKTQKALRLTFKEMMPVLQSTLKKKTEIIFFFFHGSTALVDLGLLIVQVSISHSDTAHSVGLLWTSDQLVAETST